MSEPDVQQTVYDRQSFNRRMTAIMILLFLVLVGITGTGIDLLMNMKYGGGFRLTIFSVPLLLFFCGCSLYFFFRKYFSGSAVSLEEKQIEFYDPAESGSYGVVFGVFLVSAVILVLFLARRFTLTYVGLSASYFAPPGLHFVAPPPLRVESAFDLFIVNGIRLSYSLPIATFLALLLGALSVFWSVRYGSNAVLRWIDTYPADSDNPKEAQILNVVTEMSIAAGLRPPAVYIIWDEDPNAFTVGTTPENSIIVVTHGLLKMLDRDELQGVVAHEISHIRANDVRLMSIVSILYGSVIFLSSWARKGVFSGAFSLNPFSLRGGLFRLPLVIIWFSTIVFARFTGLLIAMSISRNREYLADATAVELTRNPFGLIRALTKLENASAPTMTCRDGVAAMCIIDPKGKRINEKDGLLAELLGTHPPIRRRIFILQSMVHTS